MNAKQRLERLGWTPEKLRERIAGCRKNRVEFAGSTRVYKTLNATLYLGYKRNLRALESAS